LFESGIDILIQLLEKKITKYLFFVQAAEKALAPIALIFAFFCKTFSFLYFR
jgi:hypothetical protein